MTFEKVAKILAKYKEVDVSQVKEDTEFSTLGIDSLDIVDIVMILEDEFGITINMDESLKTVGDLVKLIDGSK